MNLVDEYLRAVSILLPKLQREDIVAELRDTILTRIEAREAELGRPLTDDEIETVLREIGHPLVIAARYREGPQHVVGPTLYPYWAFAVKLGFAIQVFAAVMVLVVQTIVGGDFGFALGRAISSIVNGGFVLVGVATVAVWLIERRGFRIEYLDEWRVRDLWFLEFVTWNWDTLRDGLGGRGWPGERRWRRRRAAWSASPPPPTSAKPEPASQPQPAPRPDASAHFPPPPARWSPVSHGLALIAVGAVLVMWWVGLTRFDIGVSAGELQAQGLDAGGLDAVNWEGLKASLFWPVLAFGVWTILRGGVHLAHPWAVRLQGLMDAVSGAAVAAFGVWLWNASPLSPAIRVTGVGELFARFTPFESHAVPLAPMATILVATIVIAGLSGLLRGLWDLMFGGPPARPWAFEP